MKILFLGLGSIGQRHLQNAKELMPQADFYAYRTTKSNDVIKNCQKSKVDNIENYYGIKITTNFDEAKKMKPDITFITNPTSLHLKNATTFAELGSHLFIEKPLSHNFNDVDKLLDLVEQKKLITMIGYQSYFNPLYEQIRQIVTERRDTLIAAHFEWSTYLPSHHPYEDYSQGYAAREDLGGGVTLCLIHEIEMIYDLFGIPTQLFCDGGKVSNLNMRAEDTIIAILKYKGQSRALSVLLNLTFAQTKEVRKFKIQFEEETLFVNLVANNYALYDKNGELIKNHTEEISRQSIFKRELTYFFECVQNKEDTFLNVRHSLESLKIALRIKDAIKKQRWITL